MKEQKIIPVPILNQRECKFIFEATNCFIEKLDQVSTQMVMTEEVYRDYLTTANNVRTKLTGLLAF